MGKNIKGREKLKNVSMIYYTAIKSELVEMKIWPLLSASMKAEKQLAYGIL